jgi:hypothetical protein
VVDVTAAAPQVFVFQNPYLLWQKGEASVELKDTYVVLPTPRSEGTTAGSDA